MLRPSPRCARWNRFWLSIKTMVRIKNTRPGIIAAARPSGRGQSYPYSTTGPAARQAPVLRGDVDSGASRDDGGGPRAGCLLARQFGRAVNDHEPNFALGQQLAVAGGFAAADTEPAAHPNQFRFQAH